MELQERLVLDTERDTAVKSRRMLNHSRVGRVREEAILACLEARAGEGGGTLGSRVGVCLSGIVSWVRIEDHLLDTPGVTEGLRCLVIMSRSL